MLFANAYRNPSTCPWPNYAGQTMLVCATFSLEAPAPRRRRALLEAARVTDVTAQVASTAARTQGRGLTPSADGSLLATAKRPTLAVARRSMKTGYRRQPAGCGSAAQHLPGRRQGPPGNPLACSTALRPEGTNRYGVPRASLTQTRGHARCEAADQGQSQPATSSSWTGAARGRSAGDGDGPPQEIDAPAESTPAPGISLADTDGVKPLAHAASMTRGGICC